MVCVSCRVLCLCCVWLCVCVESVCVGCAFCVLVMWCNVVCIVVCVVCWVVCGTAWHAEKSPCVGSKRFARTHGSVFEPAHGDVLNLQTVRREGFSYLSLVPSLSFSPLLLSLFRRSSFSLSLLSSILSSLSFLKNNDNVHSFSRLSSVGEVKAFRVSRLSSAAEQLRFSMTFVYWSSGNSSRWKRKTVTDRRKR